MEMTRRNFFAGALASGTAACLTGCRGLEVAGEFDPNFTVFMSDIHVASAKVPNGGTQPTYQNPRFRRAVDEVLAMSPKPKRVVIFGDIALWNGWLEDYRTSLPEINRLKAAGIDVHMTMGNYDKRESFLEVHPEYAKTSPVPGRIVSIVDLGTADLILLDSLHQTSGVGKGNDVDGELDDAQWDWLAAESKRRTRPFFLGAHHHFRELKRGKANVLSLVKQNPNFAGYCYGHHHFWTKDFSVRGWSQNYLDRRLVRNLCIPSTGWWGDIGFVTVHAEPDRLTAALCQDDFYFYAPLEQGAKRPPEWDAILAERRGETCTFFF